MHRFTDARDILVLIAFCVLIHPSPTTARGKYALAESCNANADFMRREIGLAVESARSAKDSLETLSPIDTLGFINWLFGTPTLSYKPLTIPRTIFGGSSEPEDIIGIANLSGETTVEDAEGGDVVSRQMDKPSMLRSDSGVSRGG